MTAAQEIADIDRLIEEARRDLLNGRYEARDTIRRLSADRQRANERAVAALNNERSRLMLKLDAQTRAMTSEDWLADQAEIDAALAALGALGCDPVAEIDRATAQALELIEVLGNIGDAREVGEAFA